MKKKQQPSQTSSRAPFFLRFLESQELSKVQGGDVTMKWPSDDDEGSSS